MHIRRLTVFIGMSSDGPSQALPSGHRPSSVSVFSAASSRATVVPSHPHLVTPAVIRSTNATQEAEALLSYTKGLTVDTAASRAIRLLACKRLAADTDEDLSPLLRDAYCTDFEVDDDIESYSDSNTSEGDKPEADDLVEAAPTDGIVAEELTKPEVNDRERLFEGLRDRKRSTSDEGGDRGRFGLLDEMLELTGHVRDSANR